MIAVAVLAGNASRGWCQLSVPGSGLSQAAPITVAQVAGSNNRVDQRVPPAAPAAEGTWVADATASAPPQALAPASNRAYYPPRPMPYGAYSMPVANVYGDPSMMPPPQPGMSMQMPPGYGPGMQPGMQAGMQPGVQTDPSIPGGDPNGSDPGDCGPNGCQDDVPWDVRVVRDLFGRCCMPINTDLWCEAHAHRRFYGSVDALVWWTRGNPTPPLLTTSPTGTPQTAAGVLGQPGTTILFGNDRLDTFAPVAAGSTSATTWSTASFGRSKAHYLALAHAGTDYGRADNFTTGVGDAILARPFFNTQTAAQDSALVAFPNFNLNGTLVNLNGSFDVRTTSNLQSAGVLLKHLLWIDFTNQWQVDLVGGYRLLRVDDSITINDDFSTQGGPLAPTTFTSTDVFGAYNTFNGGEVGFSLKKRVVNRLSFSTLWKLAMGEVHEKVTISGINSISTLGTTVTTPGGLLTQPTNIGTYTKDQFAILPEVQLNLKYDLTRNWRFQTGYSFIYLNHVQRSGSAIDTTLNPTQINGGPLVGAARPAFGFVSTGYWAQGLNFGLEYRW